MPAQARITIVGLDRIGASLGLALRRPEFNLDVVGHDPDPTVGAKAHKLGAVQKAHWNLLEACDGADVVILSLPLEDIRTTLPAIAPALRDNCVVTDTARLKAPVMAWAKASLPPGVYFVGGHPMLNPSAHLDIVQSVDLARPDLFERAAYCLTTSADCPSEAIKLISDLVVLIKAEPFYLDADEHDALVSGVDSLPLLLHLALARTVTGTTGWRDARRLADRSFALSTALVEGDPASNSASLALNRAHVLRWLDAFSQQLSELRDWVDTADTEALQAAVEAARDSRAVWVDEMAKARWDEAPKPLDIPNSSQRMAQLFGFGLFQRRPKEPAENDKRR